MRKYDLQSQGLSKNHELSLKQKSKDLNENDKLLAQKSQGLRKNVKLVAQNSDGRKNHELLPQN